MNIQTQQPVRLLLVEDDVRLATLVKDYLEQENFNIRVEHRGDSALENFDPEAVDIVILDLMLPGKDGLEVCTQLRGRFSGPILILTAKGSDIDHVMGLELGADDFVRKPIEPPVLLARLRALLRRGGAGKLKAEVANTGGKQHMDFGALSINLKSHTVHLAGTKVDLTTQEYDLLVFLANNAGKVLSRDDIFSNIRGIEYDGLDRTVDVRVSRLRKKLQDNPDQPDRIKTIWGKGYLFVEDAWS
jgi:DNA-binding response OmpR family regulator